MGCRLRCGGVACAVGVSLALWGCRLRGVGGGKKGGGGVGAGGKRKGKGRKRKGIFREEKLKGKLKKKGKGNF